MNLNLKKLLPKLLLFLVVTIVVVILLFSFNDVSAIVHVLNDVSWRWMLVAFLFLFLYLLFNPLSLFLLGREKDKENISFKHSFEIGTIEYFFNGITPFSSGGQPFQVYAYNKIGIKPARSTGILLLNFVVSQMAIVLLCLLSLVYFNELTRQNDFLKWMVLIGLIINFLILFFFLSLGISKTMRNLLFKLVSFILHRKIFKGRLERFVFSFEEYCKGAQRTFQSLMQQKIKFACCLIFKLIALICYYMIPFFILKALNLSIGISSLLLSTAMTTFSVAMTCYIPTPGASGGIEFAFQSLFQTIVYMPSSVAASGMLLWRFLTYYILMLISFIVYLWFEKTASKKNKPLLDETSD